MTVSTRFRRLLSCLCCARVSALHWPYISPLKYARSLWLEGNPIRAASISPVLAELTGNTVLKDLGLDIDQVRPCGLQIQPSVN